MRRDNEIARRVQLLVRWTRGEKTRRLAWALRRLIDRGLPADHIAAHLAAWHLLDWVPASPAAFVNARLREEHRRDIEHAAAVRPQDNADWCAALAEFAVHTAPASDTGAAAPRTDADRAAARAAARWDWDRVIDALERDYDDACDLYGHDLVYRADVIRTSRTIRLGT